MEWISPAIFIVLLLGTAFVAYRKYSQTWRNVNLGKAETVTGNKGQRWRNVILISFGQKKMFKRLIPAIMHLFVYVAFLVTQIELIEIILDGATGEHRLLYYTFDNAIFHGFYTFVISLIEVLSVLALIATFVFLSRRNLLKIPRFMKSELSGWPKLDGNIILYLEIVLVFGILTMNTADMVITEGKYGFLVSGMLMPLLEGISSNETLHIIERIGWWMHITVVFGFLLYLPYSKHFHILLAFPNTYYARINQKGEMENMPEVQEEVASMMDPEAAFAEAPVDEEIPKFGASDVFDLSWRHVLGAYTCTECGRCTAVCPANITGKKLSPRKIMMDVRDRAHEIGTNLDANRTEFINDEEKEKTSKLTKENYDDGKNLFDYISTEELRACTTCNACVEACPVLINPLDIILELRRNQILELSDSPEEWNNMFTTIENNGAPWAFPADDRDKWLVEAVQKENKA